MGTIETDADYQVSCIAPPLLPSSLCPRHVACPARAVCTPRAARRGLHGAAPSRAFVPHNRPAPTHPSVQQAFVETLKAKPVRDRAACWPGGALHAYPDALSVKLDASNASVLVSSSELLHSVGAHLVDKKDSCLHFRRRLRAPPPKRSSRSESRSSRRMVRAIPRRSPICSSVSSFTALAPPPWNDVYFLPLNPTHSPPPRAQAGSQR